MLKYTFTEAESLINFLEKNKSKYVGHKLKHLFTDFWSKKGGYSMSDEPFIIELDECFILIRYLIPSNITFFIGSEDEIRLIDRSDVVLSAKEYLVDYYAEEFGMAKKRGY